jgi:AhpD family alkylhydroperoxidase
LSLLENLDFMERISQKDLPAGLFEVMIQAQNYVDHSGIDKTLLALIKFRVSLINNCAYCIDMHFKEATHHGETPLRLISLQAWRETPYYTEKEQAVLEFAELLTKMPADESSEHIHDKLNKYFSKQEIAHLTLAVIQINSWNRLVRSFGPTPGNFKVQAKAAEHERAEAVTA